jgi:hypothetical protein
MASAAMTPSELETRSSLFRLPFESEELMILRTVAEGCPPSTHNTTFD